MIEKNCENSSKSNSSQILEENDTEISNFKLLYRKTKNPERDKSSGVSSDEETSSSSLVPLPETLKHIRNKSKWTISEPGDHYGPEAPYNYSTNDKCTGSIMNSLEEIRKKYTLKNERSVVMKMDSANMMLDDMLNKANMLKSSNESLHIKPEVKPNTTTENESLITESSAPHSQPCTHIFDHSHVPIALDFLASQCHCVKAHCNSHQPFGISSIDSIDKGASIPNENLSVIQRKKSFIEKFQDLQIGLRIQSVYKLLQKSKNPFAKNSKVSEPISIQQGIPGAVYQRNDNQVLVCKCDTQCSLKQCSKRVISNASEESEHTSSESKNSENCFQQCTCRKPKECNCPEVIPKCVCLQAFNKDQQDMEGPRQYLSQSENIKYKQTTQPVSPRQTNDESKIQNSSRKRKDSDKDDYKGWQKISSKKKELIQTTDIYYFDHGNSAYYKTTDDHPKRFTESLVERTDEYANNFWAEVFGTIEIGVAFLISFILQLYRFLFTSIIRSLIVGIIQISSDYFFKPLLTILFNGIIQPCLILAYNIATSVRDLCLPISQIFGFYARELAHIFSSCRLIEINQDRQSSSYCRNVKV